MEHQKTDHFIERNIETRKRDNIRSYYVGPLFGSAFEKLSLKPSLRKLLAQFELDVIENSETLGNSLTNEYGVRFTYRDPLVGLICRCFADYKVCTSVQS